ncbi:signal peptide peptidase SppA [Sphingomonas limnosediminicola]|uniref:Signal peptide peptidase SppA n=1 Tax=Sphingomonas limnosediminicola TaxID=940133 RepID=A0ABP7LNP2_9SPHN
MKFARAIWKLLVGIKDALVLLILLLFFGLLYASLSVRPAPVKDGVLDLDLKGSVVEQPSRASWADVFSGARPDQFRLRDLVVALNQAKDDDRVKAVALDLDSFTGGGQTSMGDLADAIRRVRDSGKPVIAYATGYTNDSYQLAAAASEVWLNPLGAVLVAGPGGSNLYYKGLLDKLGVTANVYRVGTYKSAVEPYIRNDMSPEARENYMALDTAELEDWREGIKRARPKANVDVFLQNMNGAIAAAGGDMAKAAVMNGLVDKVGDRNAFERRLAQLGGSKSGDPRGFNRISPAAYFADKVDRRPKGPIGVVTVAGMIVDGKGAAGNAGGDTIAKQILDGIRKYDVKALVVRVDSPGGSVTASEQIRQALLEARARKIPVVVSMGNVAASGGYWVSTPANYIYAEPSTITGSIGVFGVLPSFQGTLQKLGVGADGVKTTPLSGEPDLLKGPSPEANQMIQSGVNAMYARFLSIVAQSRHKTPQQVDQIAQGRVWDGGTAHQLGLVDGFGGMDEAIAKAAQLAGLGEDQRGLRYLEQPRTYRDQLLDAFADNDDDANAPADAFAIMAGQPQQQLATAMAEVRSILSGPSIQARCLDCPSTAPAQVDKRDMSLLEMLVAWLK